MSKKYKICALCKKRLAGTANKGAKTEKRATRMFGGILCNNCITKLTIEAIKIVEGIKSVDNTKISIRPYVNVIVNKIKTMAEPKLPQKLENSSSKEKKIMGVGRMAYIIKGRHIGEKVVVLGSEKGKVLIIGPTIKERKVSILHLFPSKKTILNAG